jgi:hypothetical protein
MLIIINKSEFSNDLSFQFNFKQNKHIGEQIL